MPTIKIGTTTKRVNSTSQTFTGTSLSCVLKEPCSMQNPVFQVQGLSKAALYNYASFENRYYWVDDVTYLTNNIQEVSCHLDPLATFKTAIGATSGFTVYGGTTTWSKKIDDDRVQADMQNLYVTPAVTIVDAFKSGVTFSKSGSIIMRYACCGSGSVEQGIHTVAMTLNEFKNCLTDLTQVFLNILPNLIGLNFNDLMHEINEFYAKVWGALAGSGSWTDNILAVFYVPIDISTFAAHAISSGTNIIIGNVTVQLGGTAYELDSSGVYLEHADTVTIPWRQEAIDYPFLRRPRFNALQAQILGQYQAIDTTDLCDQDTLGWYSCINLATGTWSAKVTEERGDTKEILATFGGSMAIDLMGLVSGMGRIDEVQTAGVGNLLQSGLSSTIPIIGGTVGGIAKAVCSTGYNPSAPSGGIGGNGTEVFLLEPGTTTSLGKFILTDVQYIPRMGMTKYADFCNEYGHPCGQYTKVSDHTGFVQMSGASVGNGTGGIGGSEANKTLINQYLNSGLYYE